MATKVTSSVIATNTIANTNMAAASIDTAAIAAAAVNTGELVDDAVTLAKLVAGTDGNLISYDTSGDPVTVAAGTDGQVLTSAGAGAVCLFEDAAGGGAWTLIGSSTASASATVTVTGLDSTYDSFVIIIAELILATDDKFLKMRVGDSNGIDSGASDYSYHMSNGGDQYANTYNNNADENEAWIKMSSSIGNASSECYGATLYLHSGVGTNQAMFTGHWSGVTSGGAMNGGPLLSRRKSAITLDRIELLAESGNITSGRLTVYGIKHT